MLRFLMITCSLGATAAVAVKTSEAVPVAETPVAASSDYPRYAFNYAVHDQLTKDNKAQWEMRDGGAVKGSYSLIEPDGSLRVVDYTADDIRGFNAIVKKIEPNLHPVPLAAKAPAVIAPFVGPLNYGFGGTPIVVDRPTPSLGHWSLPWDPFTRSFGGWVPITAPLQPAPLLPSRGPYATIFSKRYVDGKLHKWVTGPIPLHGKTLVIKQKH